ncbi:plastocyanin/azurin family copper-binding protein [Haloarcula rara]|uniref:plastocyanin/azurin family copper-binding protein n=1 Tax=Haloarcula rara TaxID=3033387 RepID=UPI003AF31DD8
MLGVTSSVAVVGLAGCSGGGSTDNPEGGDTTATPTEDHHDATDTESGHHEEEGDHDDGGHGHDEEIGDPTDTAEVAMLTADDGQHFEPHVVRVNIGGTVTFVNESGSHSTAAYHPDNDQPQLVPDGAQAWDSGLLSETGATFEHTFETEGVYHYYCAPHEALGMIGSVIVGEPDAHGQPALEDPPADKPDSVREKISELNEMCNDALGHTH